MSPSLHNGVSVLHQWAWVLFSVTHYLPQCLGHLAVLTHKIMYLKRKSHSLLKNAVLDYYIINMTLRCHS